MPSSVDVKQDAELGQTRKWLESRPDLLLAIAKRHTSNPLLAPSTTASPSLRIGVPSSSPTMETLRISITTRPRGLEVDIPLSPRPGSVREVRGVVRRMGEEALMHFRVPSNPKITSFLLPKSQYTFPPLAGIALLLFLLLAPADLELANQGRELVYRFLGRWAIPSAAWFAAACHFVIEPAILVQRLWRHRVPLVPSVSYLLTVVLIGYGGLEALDRAAIQERLRLLHPKSSDPKTQ